MVSEKFAEIKWFKYRELSHDIFWIYEQNVQTTLLCTV
jgi:hypothetical protein